MVTPVSLAVKMWRRLGIIALEGPPIRLILHAMIRLVEP
jgi:hypothetical protein